MDDRTKAVIKGRTLLVSRETRYGRISTNLISSEIARVIGCSLKTAQRYITKPESIPAPIRELLELKTLGLVLDNSFDGWRINDKGQLVSPIDKKLYPDQIENLHLIHQRASWQDQLLKMEKNRSQKLKETVDFWRAKAGFSAAANDED